MRTYRLKLIREIETLGLTVGDSQEILTSAVRQLPLESYLISRDLFLCRSYETIRTAYLEQGIDVPVETLRQRASRARRALLRLITALTSESNRSKDKQ